MERDASIENTPTGATAANLLISFTHQFGQAVNYVHRSPQCSCQINPDAYLKFLIFRH